MPLTSSGTSPTLPKPEFNLTVLLSNPCDEIAPEACRVSPASSALDVRHICSSVM